MAGPFYVDDGGDPSTPDGLSWAEAYVSINAADTAKTFASGEIVYFGHNHVCQATNSVALTITGPAANGQVLFISATQGSDPPTYEASSSNQIDTSEGAYDITFDGSFALYGMCMLSGRRIYFNPDLDETLLARNCTLKLGNAGGIWGSQTAANVAIENCVISCAADSGATSAAVVNIDTISIDFTVSGCTFASGTNRTGSVFASTYNGGTFKVSGCDLTTFTNATACEILLVSAGHKCVFTNCITAATWAPFTTDYPTSVGFGMFTNCGPADDPTYLVFRDYFGQCASSTAIYRTGGASLEGTAASWLITTRASVVTESAPFKTPWIYGNIASTGSKTFDLYITNDTADFTDAEVWLELEYLGTADEAQTTLTSDWRQDVGATKITTTAAAQTDDTTSTWNGTGPSFTYKQKLSVPATVNEDGQFRARVCVGVANIASSRYFYVDPKVTVT